MSILDVLDLRPLAWQDSALAGHNEIDRVRDGLSVTFDQQTGAHPWEPFGQPPICRLTLGPGASNYAVAPPDEAVATDMHKRSGGNETSLTTSVTPNGPSLAVRAAGSFSSTGTVSSPS